MLFVASDIYLQRIPNVPTYCCAAHMFDDAGAHLDHWAIGSNFAGSGLDNSQDYATSIISLES